MSLGRQDVKKFGNHFVHRYTVVTVVHWQSGGVKILNFLARCHELPHTNIALGDRLVRHRIYSTLECPCAPYYIGNLLLVHRGYYLNVAHDRQSFA